MQKSDITWFASLLGTKIPKDGNVLVAKINQHFSGVKSVSHFMETEPCTFQIVVGNLACMIYGQAMDNQGSKLLIYSVNVHESSSGNFGGDGMAYMFAMQSHSIQGV